MKETKAPTVLFLGAGASALFDLPTTKQVMEKIGLEPHDTNKQGQITKCTELLTKIYDQLPPAGKDLEGVLDFLRIAKEGMSLYRLNILKDELSTKLPEQRADIEEFIKNHKEECQQLEGDVKKCMSNLYVYRREYDSKVEDIYKPLMDALLLSPIWEEVKELPIFTTNYDMVFDALVEMPFMRRVDFIDGFTAERKYEAVFSSNVYKEEFSNIGIKLFKLHGSLNWWNRKEDNNILRWPDITPETNPKFDGPVVIYPAGYGPYPRDEFHVLHEHLEQYLRQAEHCIVVGFTFRDIGRINHIFDDVMRDNTKLQLIISDVKSTMKDLPEVHKLFGKYGDRCTYCSGGIETLPEHLKQKASTKKPSQKVDITPKEPI